MPKDLRDQATNAADATERGAIYRRIGVEPIVNGATTMTYLGGSLMPPEVLDAMRQASESFVDLYELQSAVGRRIAELTHNEAAFISGGAAAGMFLSAVVCMARDAVDGIVRPDELDGRRRDFLIQHHHRIPYDPAIELAGGRLVEVGSPDGTTERDFEAALGPETAGILHVAGAHLADGALPLETVVRLAGALEVPVIVDAAAQLPPVENLWAFTAAGADIVLFSGGKALRGPASTGLVLGRARYVDRFAAHAAPRQRIGRPMKVGKEDLIGILAAVEWYLAQDHPAVAQRYETIVDHVVAWARQRRDVTAVRDTPGQAGQPTPRVLLTLSAALADRRDEVLARLRAYPPRVELLPAGDDGLYLAPECLLPGDEVVITRRLAEVLEGLGR
ncbi:MAG: D-glucosaminate-6-phosphate ammonia-lyase [Chloroflexota bacterium]|nr:D-glucosaminate-6-phosphate ammonia-lyase [Chloroflexota bacterium]